MNDADTHDARSARPLVDLAAAVRRGERRALARAITRIESLRHDHQAEAEAMLERLLPHAGSAIRLGISGAPGAGKSTFIEELGLRLTAAGKRVAVLAVDPSSRRSGGSILGDKTRMARLGREPLAFIRPSPAGETLGGVARRTREAGLLCEAAGFDVVVIETVGVGQSETAVAEMVDSFLLLLSPGGGDELQGIKRGIVELADLIVVNKADGALRSAAMLAARDYANAVRFLRPATAAWTPRVLTCSALEGEGLDEVWQGVLDHRAALEADGLLQRRRERQARSWLWSEVQAALAHALRSDDGSRRLMRELEDATAAGRLLPTRAAERLLATFRRA
ncbi:methylmalonyl Co-A mutase-associated GTPase MeaB [Marinivivus vitaminiproducens]|uniref:methylmalonyl Co-A mutase-associated GTPase MeaB n=1 Tax=Marinivivus vitaminiproducens TaxID=3035935 RepID=UPI00279F8D86|nr:methylmalonyl Co-A mutase-associated GTPase MeaB [Geminicoccaceae bacterium SCSIO 64248]